jgi:hypothetical protein
MRFMMMVKADAGYEAGVPPSPQLIEAIGKLSEEMAKAGVLLEAGGLAPSSRGARLAVRGGKVSVTDGPFSEAKELIGGYAILRAGSREEAIALGRRFLDAHARVLGPSCQTELEIRELYGPPDPG